MASNANLLWRDQQGCQVSDWTLALFWEQGLLFCWQHKANASLDPRVWQLAFLGQSLCSLHLLGLLVTSALRVFPAATLVSRV